MARSRKLDLSKNQILSGLPEKETRRLLPHLRFVSHKLKETLYDPGEPIRYVYFPLDTVLSMLASMNDGKSVEVTLVGQEGMLGVRAMLGGKTYWHACIVQIPGDCLRMSAKVLQAEFKRGGVLQERLLHYFGYLLVQASQVAACNRLHRLEQRLVRWILMTHDRVKRDVFPITHEFLSEMLGSRRSEVTGAAGALRKAGYIRYARGTMTILNRKGLEAVVCECYQTLYSELYSLR